jgi:hypothetical protein
MVAERLQVHGAKKTLVHSVGHQGLNSPTLPRSSDCVHYLLNLGAVAPWHQFQSPSIVLNGDS